MSMKISGLPLTSSTRLIALICVLCLSGQVRLASAQTSTITVQVDRAGAAIPSTLFGIFFEDINFGADGGLYPERVKNRSFEFPEPLMGWQQIDRGGSKGTLAVLDENPINANNSHYLRMEVETGGKGFGVMNEGFRGMGLQQGAAYTFSLYARRADYARRVGNARRVDRGRSGLRIELEDTNGLILGQARIVDFTPTWKKYTVTVRPSATSLKAHLSLLT